MRQFHDTVTAFYEAVADQITDPGLLFLNYGFDDSGTTKSDWILPGDQAYRVHLNLIHHLLAGIDLEGKRVLEIGCGKGGNCLYLSRYTAAESIYGVDRCLGNIDFCRRVPGLEEAKFLAADAERLAFGANAFDVVVNLESAHCYQDFEGFWSGVFRILKPGGRLCFADIWGLDFLKVDWIARRDAILQSEFEILSAEDISRQVLLSLEQEDEGLQRFLTREDDFRSSALRSAMLRITIQLRTLLTLGQCSYRLWRCRKPER